MEDDEEVDVCGTNENANSTVNNDATVNDTHGGDEEVDDTDNTESVVNNDEVVDEGGWEDEEVDTPISNTESIVIDDDAVNERGGDKEVDATI